MNAGLADAIALLQRGKTSDAWRLCETLLAAGAQDFDTLNITGTIALQAGDAARAAALLAQAAATNPTVARTYCNLGMAQHQTQHYEAAVASFDRALALKPTLTDALINRAAALTELKRFAEARADCDAAIATNPQAIEAYLNRAIIHRHTDQLDAALADYDRVVALQPYNDRGHDGRGHTLSTLKRFPEAVAAYDRVLALKPQFHLGYISRGLALTEMDRFDDALADFTQAAALKPHDASAYAHRGEVFRRMYRAEDAIAAYDRALALDPTLRFIAGRRMSVKLQICDWSNLDAEIATIRDQVARGLNVIPAFSYLAISDGPAQELSCARMWDDAWHKVAQPLPPPLVPARRDRIRIGYFSGDFYAHAVAFLIAECIELHDRSRFEVIGFTFGPRTGDFMQQRLQKAFDRIIDVRDMPDMDVVTLARELQIDIAVDLKGLTNDTRGRLFAHRLAPVQVNYLGYPGTTGAHCMDYIIADPVLIPEADRQWYAEKVVTLPDTYQPNDSKRAVSPHRFTRADLGLPETGFVFVCFNNTYKILPHVFDVWMRILGQVEGSVLWLLGDNASMVRNLRRAAEARGISPTRLVFADRVPTPEYLARQVHGDLFLDTAPYNAHTTASDALWMGVPIVTCPGTTFASRVAASLLKAADLPELAVDSWSAYERLAVTLARTPERLAVLKSRLNDGRIHCRLFDTPRFTRHLEAAYWAMYERLHAGLPPDHILIPPAP